MRGAVLAREAFASLLTARARTLLSAFGIAIGVGSVIAMVGFGEIVAGQSMAEFASLGPDLVKMERRHGQGNGARPVRVGVEDVIDLAASVGSVADAAGLQEAHAELRWRTHRLEASQVVGVTEGYGSIAGFKMSEGRFIDDLDGRQLQCVLGSGTAASMRAAGATAVVGEWVRLFARRCTVVGVLVPAREQSFISRARPDTTVYVPIGALLRLGMADSIPTIVLRAAEEATPTQAADDASAYLRARVGDVEFEVESAKWLIRQIERQGLLFRLLLGAIGGISLTVGGVGVMNQMLTSVGERRAEIGLRRAVGARRGHIRLQFVAEAVALCVVGGVLGIALGIGATWAVCSYTELPFAVSTTPVWIGFGTSSAVGVFFGLYPAQLAARVDPIVALRQ